MSDLTIDHGGAIAVDTEQLRHVATRIRALDAECERAQDELERVLRAVAAQPDAFDGVPLPALRASISMLCAVRTALADAAAGAFRTADVYEVVELRARLQALTTIDDAEAHAVRSRIARLLAADPGVGVTADLLVGAWLLRRFRGLGDQFDLGGLLPPVFLTGALIGTTSGMAKVREGMVLGGRPDPVIVQPVATSRPSAPADLRAALGRLPHARGAQVAVERYTMPDGARRYVAYLGGTRNSSPFQAGGVEPWDVKSNLELYTGTRSASYQATLDALDAAGAKPGDRVDLVAYSQSGLIAAHLSMESEYDVGMQITVGSPTEPTLRDDQTIVQIRHSDDMVSALAEGGSTEGTGSPDSFTARRVGDPGAGPQDLSLQAHDIDTYRETARLIDTSADPRAEALDDYWVELDRATRVERTEFRAERVR